MTQTRSPSETGRFYRPVAETTPSQHSQALADRAFTRAAGAPLLEGNSVRLLEDAGQNYPAWLDAIKAANRHVHFESYIIEDDDIGGAFSEALIARAKSGVRVRIVYDWMGSIGKTSRKFWARLRASGVEVRCFNPPSLGSPLGWMTRDHRKTLEVDGRVAFVSGLCVGRDWAGDPEKQLAPWRDTGVMLRGPAVAEVQQAFAEVWAAMGEPIPDDELLDPASVAHEGTRLLRVVATSPVSAAVFRVDQLVTAIARKRLWLADAYFAGTSAYMQGLCASSRDGVDVRLLVPNASDIRLLKPVSRAGYRTLLQAGVRIFEWNGPMMHAKTAVADGRWARVGSTNLNIASWFNNYEMDVVVEDSAFAQAMEQTYLRDLANATEVVLDANHLRTPAQGAYLDTMPPHGRRGVGSAGRVVAGVVRIGNAVGAASTGRRVLEPVEKRIMLAVGAPALMLAILFILFPRVLAYPLAVVLGWVAIALLHRAYELHRDGT